MLVMLLFMLDKKDKNFKGLLIYKWMKKIWYKYINGVLFVIKREGKLVICQIVDGVIDFVK